MCFGYLCVFILNKWHEDKLTRRLAISQTVRLSAEGYASAVPGLYGGVWPLRLACFGIGACTDVTVGGPKRPPYKNHRREEGLS